MSTTSPSKAVVHAARCREKSRTERERLEASKAADQARRQQQRQEHAAKVLTANAHRKQRTHCEYGGHPWIPANLITTERETKDGRKYLTSRCRLCGRQPKLAGVKRGPIEGSRAEMRARAKAIQLRVLEADTDSMSRVQLAEWHETRARLRAEHDRLLRGAGDID